MLVMVLDVWGSLFMRGKLFIWFVVDYRCKNLFFYISWVYFFLVSKIV